MSRPTRTYIHEKVDEKYEFAVAYESDRRHTRVFEATVRKIPVRMTTRLMTYLTLMGTMSFGLSSAVFKGCSAWVVSSALMVIGLIGLLAKDEGEPNDRQK